MFLATSIPPSVDRPSGRIFERCNFWSKAPVLRSRFGKIRYGAASVRKSVSFVHDTASALTNCGGFSEALYPGEQHANCHVWGIGRLSPCSRAGLQFCGGFVVPGFWGWGFIAVLYAVVEVQVGSGSQALVVEAGEAEGFFQIFFKVMQ
jgi:hypothetical protein